MKKYVVGAVGLLVAATCGWFFGSHIATEMNEKQKMNREIILDLQQEIWMRDLMLMRYERTLDLLKENDNQTYIKFQHFYGETE